MLIEKPACSNIFKVGRKDEYTRLGSVGYPVKYEYTRLGSVGYPVNDEYTRLGSVGYPIKDEYTRPCQRMC